ncbi:MAG: hypothetical protein V4490_03350 [Pseudomonadota bacterium]
MNNRANYAGNVSGAFSLGGLAVLFTICFTVFFFYCTLPMYYDAHGIVQRIHAENMQSPFAERDLPAIDAALRLLVSHKSRNPVVIDELDIVKTESHIQIALHYKMSRHFAYTMFLVTEQTELLEFPIKHAHS